MTSKPPIKRPSRGFRATSALLAGQIRKGAEGRGFAVSKLLTRWAEIAGPDVAAICRPVEVTYGRGGIGATLVVLTTGPQAPVLEMRREELRTRINACYGYNAIATLRITQTAATGFAEGQAQFTPAPRKAAPAPDPELTREARTRAAGVHDPALRAALEHLGQSVLKRQRHNTTERP